MTYNGSVLAYMGDSVLAVQVREYLILNGLTRPEELLNASNFFVSAVFQAKFMKVILDQECLNELELSIYRRGFNYKNRSIAKNADIKSYRMATGLEALWGYWFLNNQTDRLGQMWDKYKTYTKENYGTIYLRKK